MSFCVVDFFSNNNMLYIQQVSGSNLGREVAYRTSGSILWLFFLSSVQLPPSGHERPFEISSTQRLFFPSHLALSNLFS
jgi:hypothetical protein